MSDDAFAVLDEQSKRTGCRAIPNRTAVPGCQVPFASREMPMPYGWGTWLGHGRGAGLGGLLHA